MITLLGTSNSLRKMTVNNVVNKVCFINVHEDELFLPVYSQSFQVISLDITYMFLDVK